MNMDISKIPKEFGELMGKKKVPLLQAGIMKDKNSFYLEVIIKRPERYETKILKKIPKAYKGFKVKIV